MVADVLLGAPEREDVDAAGGGHDLHPQDPGWSWEEAGRQGGPW